MAFTKPSPSFQRVYKSVRSKQLLTPYLEKALLTHNWRSWPEEYVIRVRNKEREWDGYFHPSAHCEPGPLQLYYMFHPDARVEAEERTPTDALTLHIGSVYHAVMESMLVHMGFAEQQDIEVDYVNEERWSSGTVDIKKIHIPHLVATPPVDIKSAAFFPKEPPLQYQLQKQVYMDLACDEPQELGILLFIKKSAPHDFREYVIERDEQVLESIYRKWRTVLEAVEFSDHTGLRDCCNPNTKTHWECPARSVCRIGQPVAKPN